MAEQKKGQGPHPVKTFLETTSVKGVPRIMKSRHVIFRILWALAVLLGAGIALYFLFQLFELFFSYKVTMSMTELQVQEQRFPSLTLCNLNPLGNTDRDPRLIAAAFNEFVSFTEAGYALDEEERYLMGQTLDLASLFANFGYGNKSRAWDFLVTCRWDSDRIESEFVCINSAQVHVYQTNNGNCFTFEPPENNSHIYGFSAILYLDDTLEMSLPSFELNLARPYARGAVLTAHQRDTLPLPEDGLVLSAGTSSEVHLALTKRVQLAKPYSNCSTSATLPIEGEPIVYTEDTCRDLCYQNEIVRQCGCVDGTRLSVKTHFASGVMFCRAVDIDLTADENYFVFTNMSQCIRQVQKDPNLCSDLCPAVCDEERYSASCTPITWPHPMAQIALYNRYIADKPYRDVFAVFANLSASMLAGNVTNVYDILRSNTLMSNNFLQVKVKFRSNFVTVLEDKVALGLESMLGTMGGTLNLWVGISFVTLVELIEMILNICMCCVVRPKVEDEDKKASRE